MKQIIGTGHNILLIFDPDTETWYLCGQETQTRDANELDLARAHLVTKNLGLLINDIELVDLLDEGLDKLDQSLDEVPTELEKL
jgi:hypothetical protein